MRGHRRKGSPAWHPGGRPRTRSGGDPGGGQSGCRIDRTWVIFTDEIITAMKQRGTYHVPTSYLVDAIDLDNLPPPIRKKAEEILPKARESLKKSIAGGVKIAFGTDAAVFPHGDNAKEFAVYVKLGMSPADAIRTATVNAADLLGVNDRGQIKPGLRADLIGVNGDPLADVTKLESVDFVMKQGKVYKGGD